MINTWINRNFHKSILRTSCCRIRWIVLLWNVLSFVFNSMRISFVFYYSICKFARWIWKSNIVHELQHILFTLNAYGIRDHNDTRSRSKNKHKKTAFFQFFFRFFSYNFAELRQRMLVRMEICGCCGCYWERNRWMCAKCLRCGIWRCATGFLWTQQIGSTGQNERMANGSGERTHSHSIAGPFIHAKECAALLSCICATRCIHCRRREWNVSHHRARANILHIYQVYNRPLTKPQEPIARVRLHTTNTRVKRAALVLRQT